MFRELSEFFEWFADRRRVNTYTVSRTPLNELDGWYFHPETGNLAHRTGRFFSVEGLEVSTDHRETDSWSQPIIMQPEIGILGILIREHRGVPHCLMQAKMEPGNINTLQLSPTVQATRSNLTRVHRGRAVPYLEHFTAPRRGRVVFDAVQSEQGSWFLSKRNRNMIVEVTEDVPVLEDFCWLTLDQIRQLLHVENLINMDSRTVLSGLPTLPGAIDRDDGAQHPTRQLLSWFTEAKARYTLDRNRIPLTQVKDWILASDQISHETNRYFTVIGVDVEATNREVAQWSQPMLAPRGRGTVAFLGRWTNGVLHVLVRAHTEAGTADIVEMSPTVYCDPASHGDRPAQRRPPFLDYVLAAPDSRVLLSVVHSEEGSRFYHAENHYLLVEVDEGFPPEVPDDFAWMTVEQLAGFNRYGNHVNVAARSLLTCISARLLEVNHA